MKFSANLGFLWTELDLVEAIYAANRAGFDAVECHYPYETPVSEVRAALVETDLKMLGLNTRRGNVEQGDNGLAALPGKETEARAAIDEAISYARVLGTQNVHVMAGYDQSAEGRRAYLGNLEYACNQARDLTILIEPLNRFDAPGYFLQSTNQAAEIIADIGATNLKLMFDCYHVGRTEFDVIERLRSLLPIVEHIQFASVPDRGSPDLGEVDYQDVFTQIKGMGWDMPLGAEYRPLGETDASLHWMSTLS